MFTLFLPTLTRESLITPRDIIKDFRFRIIESPSKEIRDFNNNDVEERSDLPPLNEVNEVEDLNNMKMPVKQFY